MNSANRLITFFFVFIFSAICFSQDRQHIVNAFNAILPVDSSSENTPVFSYLGTIQPMHGTTILGGYLVEQDSLILVYFDLMLFGKDSLRFLEMNFFPNISDGKISISCEMKKELPAQSITIDFYRNGIQRKLENYPYIQNWIVSPELKILCKTYQGCLDTDRSTLSFYFHNSLILTQSNLGWVRLFKIDINKNDRIDLLVISNKFCEQKLEFYSVIF
jgi:hypothetical protein